MCCRSYLCVQCVNSFPWLVLQEQGWQWRDRGPLVLLSVALVVTSGAVLCSSLSFLMLKWGAKETGRQCQKDEED